MINLIVTRHPALLQYLQEIGLATSEVEVVNHASEEIVRGRNVCGVLPHSLSSICETFTEVPLRLPPELRGQELTLEQLREYSGEPVTYRVRQL
jgi:putative CRISPR-associated protein (TIGR02620 family)